MVGRKPWKPTRVFRIMEFACTVRRSPRLEETKQDQLFIFHQKLFSALDKNFNVFGQQHNIHYTSSLDCKPTIAAEGLTSSKINATSLKCNLE